MGQVIGVSIANIHLCYSSKFFRFEFCGKKQTSELVKKYLHFPLYGATQSVFNGISAAIPTTLLTIFFAPGYAGLFWLAYRMLSLPNLIIIESVRGALFSELSERVREDRGIIRPMLIMSMVLGLFCLPISIFLFLFGEQVFSFVFGHYWNDAGRYAAIISVGWIVQNMAVPASVVLVLLHRQRSYLTLEVGLTVARVCGFAISAMWFSAEFAVAIYTALGAVHAAIVQIYAYGTARSRWRVTKQMEPA
jgi:O-antigen/teichoic acid export membrane protein